MPEAMSSLWSKKRKDPRKDFSLQLGFLAFSHLTSPQQCVSSNLADALPLSPWQQQLTLGTRYSESNSVVNYPRVKDPRHLYYTEEEMAQLGHRCPR